MNQPFSTSRPHGTTRLVVSALAILFFTFPLRGLSAENAEEGFVSLFDGESLEGWDGNPELWSVVDGVILGKTSDVAPLKRNEFLIWDGEVSDFVLKIEFRIADRGVGNSGVQYRSKRHKDEGRWVMGGYQADIERTNKYMGILYEERGRGILALRGQEVALNRDGDKLEKEVVGSTGDPADLVEDVKAGEWQTMEIVARGNHLEHKLNGRTLVRITDNDDEKMAKKGQLALQLHVGPEMQIEFRNIRLKDESPDKDETKE
ncbi:3-keto-disaccharide hydrolase [Aeoliella sp.]|uniref:3-keto-disaccharide hydrolase n=1 Tax=Aeoliella sp. TaxID=2795800 RepID=UPI003CCC39C5